MTDLAKQKTILTKIMANGGQVSVGALGSFVGSKVLSGEKSGNDEWKHNLYLLMDDGRVKEMGSGLGITSSVRITSLGEGWLNSGDQKDVVSQITGIQQRIDKIIDLDKKGLLERRELYEFRDKIEVEISGFITSADDETQRHFKKITSGWKNVPKPGYTNPGEAEQLLNYIIDFINQTIKRVVGKDLKTNIYVSAGRPFDGRSYLQSILNTAQKEIFIIDNYLHQNILPLIAVVTENKRTLNLRFLIGDKNQTKFDAFCADLPIFAKQYSTVKIDCRLHPSLHDRFIIIDGDQLYTVGSSLDSIGEKGNVITLIEEQKAKDDFLSDMTKLWDAGTSVLQT
jgi:hypothetical protein